MKIESSSRLRDAQQFSAASKYWNQSQLLRAFKLFLALARRGHASSQLAVGYFFDLGLGVRKSEAQALFWYRRSYRNGHASGASNIGTIYRDRGNIKRALEWFSRALKAGDDSSALEIAKIYVNVGDYLRAIKNVRLVVASDRVTEAETEEATTLLKKVLAEHKKSDKAGASRSKSRSHRSIRQTRKQKARGG